MIDKSLPITSQPCRTYCDKTQGDRDYPCDDNERCSWVLAVEVRRDEPQCIAESWDELIQLFGEDLFSAEQCDNCGNDEYRIEPVKPDSTVYRAVCNECAAKYNIFWARPCRVAF